MAAGTWLFTNFTKTHMLNGDFDFDTHSFKVALFLSAAAIDATKEHYSDLTNEHANQGAPGYETAGKAISTLELTGTTTVKVTETGTTIVWTATGGNITAKYAVLYEVAASHIVCYCLLDSGGADVTATTGNTFTITMNASGIFTLA